jgi:hypothetical protein
MQLDHGVACCNDIGPFRKWRRMHLAVQITSQYTVLMVGNSGTGGGAAYIYIVSVDEARLFCIYSATPPQPQPRLRKQRAVRAWDSPFSTNLVVRSECPVIPPTG